MYYVTGINYVWYIRAHKMHGIVCGKLSNCDDKKVLRAQFGKRIKENT